MIVVVCAGEGGFLVQVDFWIGQLAFECLGFSL